MSYHFKTIVKKVPKTGIKYHSCVFISKIKLKPSSGIIYMCVCVYTVSLHLNCLFLNSHRSSYEMN